MFVVALYFYKLFFIPKCVKYITSLINLTFFTPPIWLIIINKILLQRCYAFIAYRVTQPVNGMRWSNLSESFFLIINQYHKQMRKITFFLGLMLSFAFSLSASAAVGDNVQLDNGNYFIQNPNNGGYCVSDGTVVYKGNGINESNIQNCSFTFTYNEEKVAYTIQDKDGKYMKYVAANVTGDRIELESATTPSDEMYWRIVENYGPGTGYDIISLTLDNAATSQGWNFSGDNGTGANTRLGTWGANDSGSVWTVKVAVSSIEELVLEAKETLKSLLEETGGSYGFEIKVKGVDVEEIIWPNEYNNELSVPAAQLFTHANAALNSDDLDVVNAAIANLNVYKKYPRPLSVVYTFAAEYGTIVLPLPVRKPSGMTTYSCSGVDDNGILQLTPAGNIAQNTPYIVQGEVGKSYQLIGYDKKDANAASLHTGILTGVFSDTPAPVGSYVLQNQNGKLGFYPVGEDVRPTVGANRCYVTLPEGTANVRALFFDGSVTGIEGIDAATAAESVYDLSGRRVQSPQRGVYIIGGRKVFVK